MANLSIRKLADPDAERTKLFDPLTGEAILLEPADAEVLAEQLRPILESVTPSPRPFLGIKVEGEAPRRAKLPVSFVTRGVAEGWIETEGGEVVHRSSGPPEDPWGPPAHSFMHYDSITLKTVDGDVRYRVVENPDKWPEEKVDGAGFGGEVRHFYEVALDG